MRASEPLRQMVPNFALYGTKAGQTRVDLVHYEDIALRLGQFGFDIDPHTHDALLQLFYITSGGGTLSIDGDSWKIEAPSLIVVPARTVHGFRFRDDIGGHAITAQQSAIEAVAATTAPELLPFIRTPAMLPVDQESRSGRTLQPLFDAIKAEARRHERWQFTVGVALTLTLIVQMARLGEATRASDSAARTSLTGRIERFRTLLDERCRTRGTVASYADAMGITTVQLSRLCRRAFGASTSAVIDARSMHEAKRLLGYSTLGIKQVALELGFDDVAYFGRFFRKHTGIRPSQYRLGTQGDMVPQHPSDRGEGLSDTDHSDPTMPRACDHLIVT